MEVTTRQQSINSVAIYLGKIDSRPSFNAIHMSITFNKILDTANVSPEDVRLVRHKDQRSSPGRSPYELWRDNPKQFDIYQSTQRIENRKKFDVKYWAVFLADAFDDTMFVGLYLAKYKGLLKKDQPMPQRIGFVDKAGTCDTYELSLSPKLRDLAGLLIINWGKSERAWVQYADRQDKKVLEIRLSSSEPPFPGHLNFIEPLSRIGKLPNGWIEALRSSRGVYVLTCPRTKEQYIGSATGADGFHGRWLQYFANNHGGNKGLKSREPSDYQVAILEIAGSAQSHDEILAMEGRW